MEIKDNDFVNVEFDIYANGQLASTTDEKKGKEANLQIKEYGPMSIIVGKAFVLKALDEAVKKKESDKLELAPEDAYGKRQKELIRTFPKSAFDEQKLRAVPGITYDFNGMYGTVKSVVGGRVMVDFNNPLSGKNIVLEYKVVNKIEDVKDKIAVVLESVLRIPKNLFAVERNDKNVKVKVPAQLAALKDQLTKSFEEMVPEIKDYTVEIESFKKE